MKQAQFVASFYNKDRGLFEELRETLPDGVIPPTHFRYTGDGGEKIRPSYIDKNAIRRHVQNVYDGHDWRLNDDPSESIKQQMLNATYNYARTHRPDTIKAK